eukprot:241365-Prymnesium_polylepis.1
MCGFANLGGITDNVLVTLGSAAAASVAGTAGPPGVPTAEVLTSMLVDTVQRLCERLGSVGWAAVQSAVIQHVAR